jgi:hypothetical protein
LRQIFRKLDINSGVDLARLVTTQSVEDRVVARSTQRVSDRTPRA